MATQQRATRLRTLLAVLGAATVVVGLVIALARPADPTPGSTTGAPEGAVEVHGLYEGIPQRGTLLGDPRAPVTLVEFADLQCPYCAAHGRDVLPEVIRRFVRTGRVKLDLRLLTFIGPESERAARFALAAGQRGRLWQVVDLIYRNHGPENGGWVTDDYLRRIGRAAGVSVDRVAPGDELARARAEAERHRIQSTPSFVVERRGRAPVHLAVERLDAATFTAALEEALR